MKLLVELGELLGCEVVCHECSHLLIDAAGFLQSFLGYQWRTLSSGVAFGQRQGFHGVAVFDGVDTGDRGPDVAFKLHQIIGLQPPNGLSHGYNRHAKLIGDRGKYEPVTGLVVPGGDALQHMLVGLISFGETSGLHLLALFCAVSLVFGLPLTGRWEQAVNGSSVFDLFVYPPVLLLLLEGFVDDFDQHFWWDHDDAVVITDDNVAGLNGGTAAGDGAVHFPRNMAATQHGRVVAVGVDRNVYIEHGRGVTDTAVGNDGVGTAYFGTHGQDVAECSGAFFAACFHDDDVIVLHRVHGLFLLVETATVLLEQVFAVWHIAQGLGEAEILTTSVHRGWTVDGAVVDTALAHIGNDGGNGGLGDFFTQFIGQDGTWIFDACCFFGTPGFFALHVVNFWAVA